VTPGRTRLAPFAALIAGHIVSQWLRTLPAVAAEGLMADLLLSPGGLGLATGLYHAGFALGQIPTGVALDRFGVRQTVCVLLAIATLGACGSALAPNGTTFGLAQFTTGLGCCGMLMCGLRWTAYAMPPEKFGAVSGYILALGSIGLLASGTPSALLIEAFGWRGAYGMAAAAAAITLGLARVLVPYVPGQESSQSVLADARQVVRLFTSAALWPCVLLALVGYAAFIGVRGLWAGPWLTEVAGLPLVGAGHALLMISLAMAVGPALWGFIDRRMRSRVGALGWSHILGAALLVPFGFGGLGVAGDVAALTLFMALTASHILIFALARTRVEEAILGKAFSAVNLGFFGGVAVLQPLSGLAAGYGGPGAAIALLALGCGAGGVAFLWLMRRPPAATTRRP
jgi:predicted MFS family arabinose efflux permease